MSAEIECPLCDAEIPLEGQEEAGDMIVCSYCKSTFKLIFKKGKLVLTEDFQE